MPTVPARRLARKRKRERHLVRVEARRQQSCAQLIGELAQTPVRQVDELRFQILDLPRKALEPAARKRGQQIGRDAAPGAEQGAVEPAFLAVGLLRIGRIRRQRAGVDDAVVGGARATCARPQTCSWDSSSCRTRRQICWPTGSQSWSKRT